MVEFGQQLRSRIEAVGLDGKTLAKRIGVSESLLSDFTTGKKKNPPTPELLASLARELQWSEVEMLQQIGYLASSQAKTPPSEAERVLVPVIRAYDWTEPQIRAAAGAMRAIAVEMGKD